MSSQNVRKFEKITSRKFPGFATREARNDGTNTSTFLELLAELPLFPLSQIPPTSQVSSNSTKMGASFAGAREHTTSVIGFKRGTSRGPTICASKLLIWREYCGH
jgi:hypothetical protein